MKLYKLFGPEENWLRRNACTHINFMVKQFRYTTSTNQNILKQTTEKKNDWKQFFWADFFLVRKPIKNTFMSQFFAKEIGNWKKKTLEKKNSHLNLFSDYNEHFKWPERRFISLLEHTKKKEKFVPQKRQNRKKYSKKKNHNK